jgi:branched-chain amino acid transport system ATP-binding protein
MARTFQISNVFADLSAAENMMLALVGSGRGKWTFHRPVASIGSLRQRAVEGLELVGLGDRVDDPVRLLSYGETKQLDLALALNSSPKALLLDEPCAGLSPSERQKIFRILAGLPRSVTVVMIEHDMDIALGLADRVTVLHRGCIIREGTPQEIESDPEVREVYFGGI